MKKKLTLDMYFHASSGENSHLSTPQFLNLIATLTTKKKLTLQDVGFPLN